MKQNGNALFLILIAVALFAALSYAVTQSGRGGGNIDREQAQIDASQLVQIAGTVRQAYERMKLLNGIAATDVVFCDSDDPDCDNLGLVEDFCTTGTDCLFAAEGGGLTNLSIPSGYSMFVYKYTDGFSIAGNGTAAPDTFLAFFDEIGDNMPLATCSAINVGFGLGAAVEEETDSDSEFGETLPVEGEPAFCMDNASSALSEIRIYFDVLEAF